MFRSVSLLTLRECRELTMQLAVNPRVKIQLSPEMTTWMAEVSSVGSSFQIFDRELHHIKEIQQTGFPPPGPARFTVTRPQTTESCFLIKMNGILLLGCRTERPLHHLQILK